MAPPAQRSPRRGIGLIAVTALLAGATIASAHSIGDLVFKDLNNNGRLDVGEAGIPGVAVQLVNLGTGVVTPTLTGPGGIYNFDELLNGQYQVRVPLGQSAIVGCGSSTGVNAHATGPYEQPAPDPNNDVDNDDNGQLNADGTSLELSTPGILTKDIFTNLRVDFGIVCFAKLGDFVWEDLNKNGFQDSGEPGINGVGVTLRDVAGTTVATTTTSGNGAYAFANVTPGTYSVQFQTPTGMTPTPSIGTTADALNSDAKPDGATSSVTLTERENNPNIDAGFSRVAIATPVLVPGTTTPDVVSPPVVSTGNVLRPTEISVTKTGPARAKAGTTATYRIVVRVAKGSGATARQVVVRDFLPLGMTIVRQGQFSRGRLQSGAVTWSLGDLAPGVVRSVDVAVRIASDARGTLRNRATAQAENARAVEDAAATVVTPRTRRPSPAVTG